jgi:hypothetical protein
MTKIMTTKVKLKYGLPPITKGKLITEVQYKNRKVKKAPATPKPKAK